MNIKRVVGYSLLSIFFMTILVGLIGIEYVVVTGIHRDEVRKNLIREHVKNYPVNNSSDVENLLMYCYDQTEVDTDDIENGCLYFFSVDSNESKDVAIKSIQNGQNEINIEIEYTVPIAMGILVLIIIIVPFILVSIGLKKAIHGIYTSSDWTWDIL